MRSIPRLAAILAVFVYFTIFALSWNGQDAGAYDEPISALGARMLLAGARPHSDFWSVYPAGFTLMDAAAFAIFGQSISVQRCLQAAFAGLAGCAVLFFVFRRDPGRPWTAALVAVCAAASIFPGAAMLSGFALAAAAVMFHAGGAPRWIPPVLTAAAALCRINFGAYAAVSILACGGLRDLGRFAAVGLPAAAGYLLFSGASVADIFSQVLIEPGKLMSHGRFLPAEGIWPLAAAALPGLWIALRSAAARNLRGVSEGIGLALGLSGCVHMLSGDSRAALVALPGALLAWQAHRFVGAIEEHERAILLFACFTVHYYLSRSDQFHAWPLFAPALLAAAFALRNAAPAWTAAVVLPSLAAMLTLYGFRPQLAWARNTMHIMRTSRGSEIVSVDDPARFAGSWGAIYLDGDEQQAVRYVRSRTAPDEPVFLGLVDHSRTFANCLRSAWLLGRPTPVWHFVFEPGITTREEMQHRMIGDLEARKVRWLLLTDWAGVGDPGFFARKEQGSTALDGYIRERFNRDAKFGLYEVWQRKP